jgi:hypothetical protein
MGLGKRQQENAMAMKKTRTRLMWRGQETVREILDSLHKRERTLLVLPAGFHHAVNVSVSGDEDAHAPTETTLDRAAFDRLVRIRGLRELAELREPLAEAGMEVRVRTPPPQLGFVPREEGMRRRMRDGHHGGRRMDMTALARMTT